MEKIVIFLRMLLTFFSLPSRYLGIIFDMSAQESRIDHSLLHYLDSKMVLF